MTDQIETFYRTGYVDFIRLQAMTLKSALEDTVDFEPMKGEPLMIDSYGQPSPGTPPDVLIEFTGARNAANSPQEVPRARRQLSARWWEYTERFSMQDPLRTMRALKPDSSFSRSVLGAFATQADILIITAFGADATDGAGGAITFTAANTIDQTIGADESANADRIITGYFKLVENKVPSVDRWYGATHPIQIQQMFARASDHRITSGDFRTMKPLETGHPGNFMNVEWRVTPDIPDTANIYSTVTGKYQYMYSFTGMIFGKSGGVDIHFDILAHLRHSLQAAHYRVMSATRMHETHVVRLINDNLITPAA